MIDTSKHRADFRLLHQKGCFVIPNPWDIGSARYLQHLGFKALATTSGGFAFSRGLPDSGAVAADLMIAHIADLVSGVDVPVNADFQSGFSATLEGVAANVKRCIETGVSGLSIEDATGDKAKPLFEISQAVERIKAARGAIEASRADVLLTARAECYLVGHQQPLRESITRLRAYADAGADVLYAPGLQTREAIQAVIEAVSPKPVNVLVSSNMGLSVQDLAGLGVRRVSVGSALARAAWTGFIHAAVSIIRDGVFTGFEGLVKYDELERLFWTFQDRSHLD
jgi:2-methylisocitrate lyase-like PEP mutase family enzyme